MKGEFNEREDEVTQSSRRRKKERLRRMFIRLAEYRDKMKEKQVKRVQVDEETNGVRRCKIKESGDVSFFFFFVTFVGASFR